MLRFYFTNSSLTLNLFILKTIKDDYIQIPMIIKKVSSELTLAKGFNICFSFSVLSF